jgi:hypothetical protein
MSSTTSTTQETATMKIHTEKTMTPQSHLAALEHVDQLFAIAKERRVRAYRTHSEKDHARAHRALSEARDEMGRVIESVFDASDKGAK